MLTIAHDHLNNRVHIDATESALEYFCPVCGAPLDTKKGPIKRHHFAHKAGRTCTDSWHGTYSDSEWHFAWQERYPLVNRELTLRLDQVRHRADVVAGRTVVEFQHSALSPSEFNDRNAFYADLGYKVVWLYDLRNLFESGAVTEEGVPGSLGFRWENPRKSFNSYDVRTGTADLFFQLRDEGEGTCIVQVDGRSESGFEGFTARRWMTADDFLAFTGLRDGTCAPPCMDPLEPNEDYLNFQTRYGIKLNKQQKRAVQAVDGATLLLAVPGSGKTTVMVARIGYLILERHVPPEQVVAITFTNAAANEMRDRFARRFGDASLARRIRFCTINSLCYEIYRRWASAKPGRRTRKMMARHDQRALLLKALRGNTKKFVADYEVTELETAISLAKNLMLDEASRHELDQDIPHFSEMYSEYCTYLKNKGFMDFDDQIAFAKYALETDEAILQEYRSAHRYWCIDEAQDTSALQHRVIETLTKESNSVFMVGDEDQSIFGYRGACPEELLNFRFTYANAFVLKMERNYRSGKEIVEAANAFVAKCKGRYEKRMVSDSGATSIVRAMEVSDRMGQYDAAYEVIRFHGEAVRLAVIYRDNETGIPLVDRLARDEIPFQLLSKANTFFTSPAVRDISAYMNLALNPYDTDAFRLIWAKCGCYIKRKDVSHVCRNTRQGVRTVAEALCDQMSTYRGREWEKRAGAENALRFSNLMSGIATLPPLAAIDRIMSNGYAEWLSDSGASSHRIDILRQVASRESTVESFLDRLDELSAILSDRSHDKPASVVLSTAHSCKGREFERVLILDAVEGSFPSEQKDPHRLSKDAAIGYQEERRLFYVAMTRAKDELILMRPAGEATSFVDEVVPRMSQATSAPSPSSPQTPQAHEVAPHGKRTEAATRNEGRSQGRMTCSHGLNGAKAHAGDKRYDIDAWEVLERHGNQRLVARGEIQAVITDGWGRRYVDMDLSLDATALSKVTAHIDDLASGASSFNLCVDVWGAQEDGTVAVEDMPDGSAVMRLQGDGASEAIVALASLLTKDIDLSVNYRGTTGQPVGRRIESVLEGEEAVTLSRELLEVF